mmetsp:Transcript_20239/g.21978  ORF Transcript_20239/g.21978 Transcript_20239/m.21978 type:complete len:357 (+) Transcript_20239:230-1300(+)
MTRVTDNYRLIRKIGSGGFSSIYLAENEFGEQVAIKSIKKRSNASSDYYFREARIHYLLSQFDEKIVKFYEMYEDDEYVHFVLEYLPGGDLFDTLINQMKMKKFYSEKIIKNIIKNLLQSVQTMHANNIVHRDLKLENLLLVNKADQVPNIKLADFGLAVEDITGDNITTFAGTPLYMAPENHRKESYGKPVDIWAVGLITYLLFCGNLPFGNDENFVKARVLKGEFQFREKEWQNSSSLMRDFIKNMLKIDPRLRPTVEESLNHPWFHYDDDEMIDLLATMSVAVESRKRVLSDIDEESKRRKVMNESSTMTTGRCCPEDDTCFQCLDAIYNLNPADKSTRLLIPPMETIFSIVH